MKSFSAEWQVLQNQYDAYEKWSLVIKLVAIGVCVFAIEAHMGWFVTTALLAILWLQDGIWKTFQSRIEQRLLAVEAEIEQIKSGAEPELTPMQFNRQFADNRPGLIGLIKEYLSQAQRPTIAFPHAALILVSLLA